MMYTWEKVQSSGSRELYMRVRFNRWQHEDIYSTYGKLQRFYNAASNEWDFCKDFCFSAATDSQPESDFEEDMDSEHNYNKPPQFISELRMQWIPHLHPRQMTPWTLWWKKATAKPVKAQLTRLWNSRMVSLEKSGWPVSMIARRLLMLGPREDRMLSSIKLLINSRQAVWQWCRKSLSVLSPAPSQVGNHSHCGTHGACFSSI